MTGGKALEIKLDGDKEETEYGGGGCGRCDEEVAPAADCVASLRTRRDAATIRPAGGNRNPLIGEQQHPFRAHIDNGDHIAVDDDALIRRQGIEDAVKHDQCYLAVGADSPFQIGDVHIIGDP